MFDLLIKGGLVLDGAANPGIFLSVAIKDNRIHLLRGDISNIKAHRTIDATGKVVSPGFIDVHAHSGLVILSEPEHMPKVHQGCLLYTSPSPRDGLLSRMPSSA